uniref:Biotin carboxylase (Fragments) n=1 Tax=Populus euphratica TaxID=75702 RepID=ACCC_POPEU|nr:RecName: Full=Biotin carboxylase; AltName: Full=Acetyl-coenzyme A carboxylase biotin carboxylase subunit A [Populus euphratica]
ILVANRGEIAVRLLEEAPSPALTPELRITAYLPSGGPFVR